VRQPALNEEKLKKFIKRKEGERMEFKSSLADLNRLVEIVASFANSGGGTLFIGVHDDGGVLGAEIGNNTIEKLTNTITDNTDPTIYPRITTPKVNGKKIIRVDVSASSQKPHLAFGKPFKRSGNVTKLMSRNEYERLLLSKPENAFDSRICSRASLTDIDPQAILDFKKKYESVNETRLYGSDEEVLKSRGCLTDDGRVTNAGILLFGKNPQQFIQKAYITVVRYPETAVTDTILDSKDFFGNLFDQIDRADQYLREHIQVISKIPEVGLARQDTPVYPYFVLRELIVNAAVHRDYTIYGSRILIQMFADRIEFYSPGGFPEGITPENIRWSQRSRNPTLARVLHDVKYLEEFGNGVDRIYETIEEYPLKLQYPMWKDINVAVITTLLDLTYEKKLDISKIDLSGLNERQRKALDLVSKEGQISNKDYRKLFRVSGKTSFLELNTLVERSILVTKGSGRSVVYLPR
jgi:ATP-dependent DNA helicase RecG